MPVTKASPAKKATPGRPKDVDKDLLFLYQMITSQGQFKVNTSGLHICDYYADAISLAGLESHR